MMMITLYFGSVKQVSLIRDAGKDVLSKINVYIYSSQGDISETLGQ